MNADAIVGAIVGHRYLLVQRIATGGVGHIYLAAQREASGPGARSHVALKMLRPELCARRALVARFDREAIAAARVASPHVVEIYGAPFEDRSARFFAMELLLGHDLGHALAYDGPIEIRRALSIGVELCAGLAAVHAAGVVHRDIKPENVFLARAEHGREVVKIIDFGFASLHDDPDERAASRRAVLGTPAYMAPEQARGAPAEPSADLYAAGVLLYEMLSGRPPFTGSPKALTARHAKDPPPPLRVVNPAVVVAPRVEALIMKALAKDPKNRFSSALAFGHALAAELAESPPER